MILEGSHGASAGRCNGTIVAVGTQDVSIRRGSDLGVVKVTVQQLKAGRYSLLVPGKHGGGGRR